MPTQAGFEVEIQIGLNVEPTTARIPTSPEPQGRHATLPEPAIWCHSTPYAGSFFELDTRLSKNIKIGEKANVQLIAQAFNLTNRANHGNDVTTVVTSPDFRKAAGFINPTSTNIPRSLTGEFGFRFPF